MRNGTSARPVITWAWAVWAAASTSTAADTLSCMVQREALELPLDVLSVGLAAKMGARCPALEGVGYSWTVGTTALDSPP